MGQTNEKQILAFNYFFDDEHTDILYGGAAGGGKSALGCFALATASLNYPETRWYIARKYLKDIRKSTLVTWGKMAKHYGYDKEYKFNLQDNYIEFKNGSRIDLLDCRFLPSDPMYERLGSYEYTGGFTEEGGEIESAAQEVLSTRTGRHLNKEFRLLPKRLITCNPKRNWMYEDFVKPYKNGTLEDGKAYIFASANDNPYLTEEYRKTLDNIKDPVRRARLRDGDWEYDDDPGVIIDESSRSNYFTNTHVKPQGQKYMTIDVARKGKDHSVIRVWSGWVCIDRVVIPKCSIDELHRECNVLRNKHSVPLTNILADEDGVGGGLVDYMKCKGFVNNSRPVQENDGSFQHNYPNLKTQCSHLMALKICSCEVYETGRSEGEKERIKEEMGQVRQDKIDDDGKFYLVPKSDIKQKLGRSPDDWDSIMMRYYFELNRQRVLIKW